MTPEEAGAACDREYGCITCSDQGILMRVSEISTDGLARCTDPEGELAEVEVDLVDGVVAGDMLLVHAGVALARVDRPVPEHA